MEGGADMDVRPMRFTEVGNRGFECIERPKLIQNMSRLHIEQR